MEQATATRGDALVAILDLTPRMLATDLPPTRLEQARRTLVDLLEARRGAQTGIVVYAGSAHVLVPLSDDVRAHVRECAALLADRLGDLRPEQSRIPMRRLAHTAPCAGVCTHARTRPCPCAGPGAPHGRHPATHHPCGAGHRGAHGRQRHDPMGCEQRQRGRDGV